jgi:hypothetical protein
MSLLEPTCAVRWTLHIFGSTCFARRCVFCFDAAVMVDAIPAAAPPVPIPLSADGYICMCALFNQLRFLFLQTQDFSLMTLDCSDVVHLP